jgi:hypothetical protein
MAASAKCVRYISSISELVRSSDFELAGEDGSCPIWPAAWGGQILRQDCSCDLVGER